MAAIFNAPQRLRCVKTSGITKAFHGDGMMIIERNLATSFFVSIGARPYSHFAAFAITDCGEHFLKKARRQRFITKLIAIGGSLHKS
jgi:hypothetical protein